MEFDSLCALLSKAAMFSRDTEESYPGVERCEKLNHLSRTKKKEILQETVFKRLQK